MAPSSARSSSTGKVPFASAPVPCSPSRRARHFGSPASPSPTTRIFWDSTTGGSGAPRSSEKLAPLQSAFGPWRRAVARWPSSPPAPSPPGRLRLRPARSKGPLRHNKATARWRSDRGGGYRRQRLGRHLPDGRHLLPTGGGRRGRGGHQRRNGVGSGGDPKAWPLMNDGDS